MLNDFNERANKLYKIDPILLIQLVSTMSILDSLQEGFVFLRRDGFFIEATMGSEDTIRLEVTTYVVNAGTEDADCLCVHEDELGLGGSCVCEEITSGEWLKEGAEMPRGCVACPVCQRLSKPGKLQKRCYSLTLKVNEASVSPLNSQPNENLKPMPIGMSEKIVSICNAIFPEVTYTYR